MWEALIALRLEESEQEIRKMEGGRQRIQRERGRSVRSNGETKFLIQEISV